MKTPLPEKIQHPEIKLDLILNQIITYLAELSEVVEGKQGRNETRCPQCVLENNNGICDRKDCSNHQYELADTLKDKLMGEIRGIFFQSEYLMERTKFDEIEAIVNRLIP